MTAASRLSRTAGERNRRHLAVQLGYRHQTAAGSTE